MVNSISNNQGPNYGNAIGTSLAGGVAWGAGQYIFNKKPFMNRKGELSDIFVKKMEDALIAIKDKATLDNVNFQKKLEKGIDELVDVEKLKEFVNKNKDDFMSISEKEVAVLNEEIGKIDFSSAKELVKGLFKNDGKYTNYYKETLDSCYDGAQKKLVHDAKKITKEKFDVIKKVISKERITSALKSAGAFVACCAVLCCLSEFIMARTANKKEK